MIPPAKAIAVASGIMLVLAGCCAALAQPEPSYEARRGPWEPVVVSGATPQAVRAPEAAVASLRPTGQIDDALLGGKASWYDDPRKTGLYAAAGPALRVGDWRGSRVRVCVDTRCVTVTLSDACQCYRGTEDERVVDLSPSAFTRLAPLSRGVIAVSVER